MCIRTSVFSPLSLNESFDQFLVFWCLSTDETFLFASTIVFSILYHNPAPPVDLQNLRSNIASNTSQTCSINIFSPNSKRKTQRCCSYPTYSSSCPQQSKQSPRKPFTMALRKAILPHIPTLHSTIPNILTQLIDISQKTETTGLMSWRDMINTRNMLDEGMQSP
jgi:hypothetical protein